MLTAALFAIGLVACSKQCGDKCFKRKKEKQTEKLTAYTTIFLIQDFTGKIGGSHVHAQSVYPCQCRCTQL
ncbi:hypothetical protein ACEQPO_22825 [Bacillus sp. SL00103]